MLSWEIENKYRALGHSIICGTDEAGRGPIFGPVAAAACILPPELEIEGLDDSKKLSPKKREALFSIIIEKAVSYAVAYASVEEIEDYNILNASMLAMRRAVEALEVKPSLILADGLFTRGLPGEAVAVKHGDALSPSIAAASILAKVSRDRLCAEYDALYPGYGIAGHKGYGTRAHFEAIKKLGLSPLHRAGFIKPEYLKKA